MRRGLNKSFGKEEPVNVVAVERDACKQLRVISCPSRALSTVGGKPSQTPTHRHLNKIPVSLIPFNCEALQASTTITVEERGEGEVGDSESRVEHTLHTRFQVVYNPFVSYECPPIRGKPRYQPRSPDKHPHLTPIQV
jgi:hypothetical protein